MRKLYVVSAVALLVAGFGCGDDESTTAPGATASSGSGGNTSSGSTTSSAGGGLVTTSSTSGSGGTTSSSSGSGGSGGSTSSSGSGGMMATTTISMSSCSGSTCDFTFNATGFGAQDGKTIYVGVQQQGQSGNVTSGNAVISGGSATIMNAGVLTKGLNFNVNYFVDVDSNNACDIGGQDLIWRESFTATGHVTVNAGYTTDFSNLGCSGLP